MSTVIEDVTDIDPSENDEVLVRIFNQVRHSSSTGIAGSSFRSLNRQPHSQPLHHLNCACFECLPQYTTDLRQVLVRKLTVYMIGSYDGASRLQTPMEACQTDLA